MDNPQLKLTNAQKEWIDELKKQGYKILA